MVRSEWNPELRSPNRQFSFDSVVYWLAQVDGLLVDCAVTEEMPWAPDLERCKNGRPRSEYREFAAAYCQKRGDVAQLEEHRLCKPGVVGSSPIVSTRNTIATRQVVLQ